MYVPRFENGEAINGAVRMSSDPVGFDGINAADALLTANLYGGATSYPLTVQELGRAYTQLDHEMSPVAILQRSLLPASVPAIDSLDIAVAYETAARAGGDYYDFLDLGDGRWGMLITDASDHGDTAKPFRMHADEPPFACCTSASL